MNNHYLIAGFRLNFVTLSGRLTAPAFKVFETTESASDPDFTITQVDAPLSYEGYARLGVYEWFEAQCELLQNGEDFIWNRIDSRTAEVEQLSWSGYRSTQFSIYSTLRSHVVDHLGLIAFNYAALAHDALILHSSVVENSGKGYLFLGESGTGKSTHTKLWLKHIEGSEILNDDAPIVRIIDGAAIVCGSPWSGKGRVFKNKCVPIHGIYRLSQAPYNQLTALDSRTAFAAMLHSCLPPLMEVEQHTDMAFETLSTILTLTKQFHLACLPDQAAAQLSHNQR